MKIFKHYVITRFNLKNKGWHYDKNNQSILDDAWLRNRIMLFETFCLPSIVAQSNKDFEWLVYFDKSSPDFLLEKITDWCNRCANLSPQYSIDYETFQSIDLPKYIVQHTIDEYEFVITTRLDNDDALRNTTIEKIQKTFIPKSNVIIDCINGYCYDRESCIYTKHTMVSNPFISYIESTHTTIYSVYKEEHPNWIGKATFITIKRSRMWFQVIHGKNLINTQHGIICFKPCLKSFGLNPLPCVNFKYILKNKSITLYYLFKHHVKKILYKLVGRNI